MKPSEINNAIFNLAPDAIACIERTLRGSIKPVKAQVDCAWKVLDMARGREEVVEDSSVADLANVLQLVES
jgi:hypothetical protein